MCYFQANQQGPARQQHTNRKAVTEIVQPIAHDHHPGQCGNASILQLLSRVALAVAVGVVVLVVVVVQNMMVVVMVVNEVI